MTDLLDQETVDDFRSAMRDLTDTFHKTEVTLRRQSGEEIDLQAGWKPDDTGSYGSINGEAYVEEAQRETVERYIVTFNRDYLAGLNLIDAGTDKPLITEDDKLVFKGKRHTILKITDKGVFRGLPILVQLTVQR